MYIPLSLLTKLLCAHIWNLTLQKISPILILNFTSITNNIRWNVYIMKVLAILLFPVSLWVYSERGTQLQEFGNCCWGKSRLESLLTENCCRGWELNPKSLMQYVLWFFENLLLLWAFAKSVVSQGYLYTFIKTFSVISVSVNAAMIKHFIKFLVTAQI